LNGETVSRVKKTGRVVLTSRGDVGVFLHSVVGGGHGFIFGGGGGGGGDTNKYAGSFRLQNKLYITTGAPVCVRAV